MDLIGQDILLRAVRRNRPLNKWLKDWVKTVENSDWQNPNDVRQAYSTADGVKLKSGVVITVFNAKGNNFRLLTAIDFDAGTVEALEVLTHPEYDKNMWKNRY